MTNIDNIINYLVNRYGYERAYFDQLSDAEIVDEYNELFIFGF